MCRSNYYRYWDAARYLWKKSSFYHTLLHLTPPLGGSRRNIGTPFGMEILEWCRYPMVKNFEDMFIYFDVIHDRDGRADRQTLQDSKDSAYASHRAVKSSRCTHWTGCYCKKKHLLHGTSFQTALALIDAFVILLCALDYVLRRSKQHSS